MRAERLAARGLASMPLPGEVTPAALDGWMARPPPPRGPAPDMGGLDRVRVLAERAVLAPTSLAA